MRRIILLVTAAFAAALLKLSGGYAVDLEDQRWEDPALFGRARSA